MRDAVVQVDVADSVVQTLLQSMDATVSIAAVSGGEEEAWEYGVAIPAVVGQTAGHAPSQEVVISADVDVIKFQEIEQFHKTFTLELLDLLITVTLNEKITLYWK